MANKKINQLGVRSPLSLTDLMLVGDPSTGYSYKTTIGDLSTFFESNIALNDLSDVTISSPANGNLLAYNGTQWVNRTLGAFLGGTVGQYVRGDGTLGDFSGGGGGGGASVSYYLNGSVNQGTIGGVTYLEMNKNPIIGAGTDFTRNTNGYIASFLTDANDPALLKIPGGNWNLEFYFSASSGGGTPTFYVELYKYDGSTFTLIASNSTTPEAITGGTVIDAYFTTLSVPETVLTLNDRLAIRVYTTTVGRTITLHTENSHLCQVITTFTTGLTALNNLTAQVQFFATGTTGSDFNISSTTATHTFNIPTASGTNRGALSSADWTTFNSKQNAITLTTTGSSGSSTFISNTLNIPTYTLSGLGGVPTTRTLTINGTSFDLSADRTWTISTGPTGSGTTNYISKWTSSTALGNSQIFDNGTSVGIGTTTPAAGFLLDVNGNLRSITGQFDNSAQVGKADNTSSYPTLGLRYASGTGADIQGYNAGTGSVKMRMQGTGTLYINTPGNMIFCNAVNETNESMRIVTSTKNVLIGTSTDGGFKLDVNGTARVSGNLTVSGPSGSVTNLDIFGGTTGGSGQTLRIYGSTPASQGLFLTYTTATAESFIDAGYHATSSGASFGDIIFRSKQNATNTLVENMRIRGFNGNLVLSQDMRIKVTKKLRFAFYDNDTSTDGLEIYLSNTPQAFISAPFIPALNISVNGGSIAQFTSTNMTLRGDLSISGGTGGSIVNTGSFRNFNLQSNGAGTIGRTAGSPAYSFYGDLTTGMWQPATGSIDWSISGVSAMRLSTASNLLLGTTTDAGQRLQVNGNIQVDNAAGQTSRINTSTTGKLIIGKGAGHDHFVYDGSTNYVTILNLSTNFVAFRDGIVDHNGASYYQFRNGAYILSHAQRMRIDFNDQASTNRVGLQLNYGAGAHSSYKSFQINDNVVEKVNIDVSYYFNTLGGASFGTLTKNASALLTMESTTQGLLMPRMTGLQAEAITTPATGLLVYANNGNGTTITSTGWWGYDGTTWVKLN